MDYCWKKVELALTETEHILQGFSESINKYSPRLAFILSALRLRVLAMVKFRSEKILASIITPGLHLFLTIMLAVRSMIC